MWTSPTLQKISCRANRQREDKIPRFLDAGNQQGRHLGEEIEEAMKKAKDAPAGKAHSRFRT